MQFKNDEKKAEWEKGLACQGPYGQAGYRFAQRWADAMELAMAHGDTVAACYEDAGHEADTEGITGFMYGCAVSVLANVWKHGENLRQRHNLDTQIGREGEKANKTGAVLNPALLTIT